MSSVRVFYSIIRERLYPCPDFYTFAFVKHKRHYTCPDKLGINFLAYHELDDSNAEHDNANGNTYERARHHFRLAGPVFVWNQLCHI
jgi:hypothetical protein